MSRNDHAAPLSLGFSPCPNDTFIFHALVHNLIGACQVDFQAPVLADVETLNLWAMAGRLDVTKVSFHAFGHLAENYVLLGAGGALGRGCGPLLVGRRKFALNELEDLEVAIPGEYTTATMLLKLLVPKGCRTVAMPFDRIMASVAKAEVDAGVIIHESRFTYPDHGLHLIQDLGQWWEAETGHPIPLGGIIARRSLGRELIGAIDQCIRDSVRHALAAPQHCRDYVRCHAQELTDSVIAEHIKLYVNHFSEDIGGDGLAAVDEFLHRGTAAGLFGAPRCDFCLARL